MALPLPLTDWAAMGRRSDALCGDARSTRPFGVAAVMWSSPCGTTTLTTVGIAGITLAVLSRRVTAVLVCAGLVPAAHGTWARGSPVRSPRRDGSLKLAVLLAV